LRIFLGHIARAIVEGAPAKIGPSLSLPKQEEYRNAAIRVADLLVTKQGMSTEQAKNYITRKIPNHPEFTSLVDMALDDYANQTVSPPSRTPTADSPKPLSPNQPGIAGKSEPQKFSSMK
jgi:hypothetical protein